MLREIIFSLFLEKQINSCSVTQNSEIFADIASRHMSDMTSTFKTKTEKFVSDIQSDLRQGKPILKHPNDSKIIDSDEPRTYREESRLSEHGNTNIFFLNLKDRFGSLYLLDWYMH